MNSCVFKSFLCVSAASAVKLNAVAVAHAQPYDPANGPLPQGRVNLGRPARNYAEWQMQVANLVWPENHDHLNNVPIVPAQLPVQMHPVFPPAFGDAMDIDDEMDSNEIKER